MNMNKIMTFSSAVLLSLSAGANVYAASCTEYPYRAGLIVEDDNNGNWKLVATGSVDVHFDDVSSVNEARKWATAYAKEEIVKFLEEANSSSDALDKATKQIVEKQSDSKGESKQARESSVRSSLQQLASSASATLRGVLVIGDCYTPAREYRVTVGMKPQTIQAAGNVSSGINHSISKQPPPTGSPQAGQPNRMPSAGGAQQNTPSSGSSMSNTPGFSNTQNLQKF